MVVFSIFLPLISFFIFIFFSKFISSNKLIFISILNILISTILSFFILKNIIISPQSDQVLLFNWLNSGSLNSKWFINVDFLSFVMVFIVNLVSTFVQIYSVYYMKNDASINRFFCYLNLFSFFMLLLVTSGNLLQLFVGWEGVGLCSYLLIGFWYVKNSASNAALKAFIINRIGDTFFIIGIIFIYLIFDTIFFSEIFQKFNKIDFNTYNFLFFKIDDLTIITLLLLLGAMGKSAQIGLHTWLPDAMEGPTPVSALIHAATMVTAGVFLLCKMSIFFNNSILISNLVILIGSITSIYAASVAITENDIKKIIAYSTCSQLGFMFIAAGFSMYNLAIFHLVTHAFFKALLFLGAGSVIHTSNDEQNIKKMGNLWNKIPLTYLTMIIGSLSLSGIPLFAGYYSKELIVNSGLNSNLLFSNFVYFISIIVVLLTSIYSFRLIFYVFHNNKNKLKFSLPKFNFSSFFLFFPLISLAFLAIFSGYFIKDYFITEKFLGLWISSNVANNISIHHQTSFYLSHLPTLFSMIGILFIFYFYFFNNKLIIFFKTKFKKTYYFFCNKWYFDYFYDKFIVKKIINLADNLWKKIDIELIDRIGPNGLAFSTKNLSKFFSNFQTGYIYHYAFSFIIGLFLLITFLIFFFN